MTIIKAIVGTKRIEDVIEKLIDYRGKTPTKTTDGVVLVTAKVIKDGRIWDNNHEYIAEEDYDVWMRRGLPKQGDVLITTEAPLGEVAQLRTNEKIALAQRVILLRANPKIMSSKYLFYALRSPFVQAGLQARGTGTTVLGIKQSELREILVPCPTLEDQQEIESILAALDDLLENNTKRIKILEDMARLIYREWFVHYRFPKHEKVKIVDSETELGQVPEGWQVLRLEKVCESIMSGGTPRTSSPEYWGGIIPWLSSGETGNNFIFETEKTITEEGVSESSTRLARSGCTVIASAGQGKTRGQTSMLRIDSYINQSVIALMPDRNLITDNFLFFDLERRYNQFRQISDGSTRGSLTTKLLADLAVVVPSPELVSQFDSIVEPMVRNIESMLRKNNILRRTRDLLLPKLISGQLAVA